jgi:hypothetical protein
MQLIITLVLIGGSLAGFFGYITPHWNTIGGLKKQQSAYEDVLVKAREAEALKKELQVKYESFSKNDKENLQKILPDTVDNIRLLLDLNQIALAYGTNLISTHIDTPQVQTTATQQGEPTYGSLGITFSVKMTYENFLRFLHDIQRNLRLTDVTAVTFTSDKDNLYTFSVGLRTYWLK